MRLIDKLSHNRLNCTDMASDLPIALPRVQQHFRVCPGTPEKVHLPEGVLLFPLKRHADERGFFMEVIRCSALHGMGFVPRQISVSRTRMGVTKAFHYHDHQSDLFCPLEGNCRIVLLDRRPESATHGLGYSIFSDPEKPFVVHIPPGVAHGYRVSGEKDGLMLYIMDREYDPSDEHRAAWDDPSLAFPWDEKIPPVK